MRATLSCDQHDIELTRAITRLHLDADFPRDRARQLFQLRRIFVKQSVYNFRGCPNQIRSCSRRRVAGIFDDCPEDLQTGRFRRFHQANACADATRLTDLLRQALPRPFPAHLDETER